MKFHEFIHSEAIVASMEGADKESAILELIDGLIAAGRLQREDRLAIHQAIMRREELNSTAIGRGVAVPHTKHASVSGVVGTVGVCARGVDFGSPDGEPVQLLFLLISPPDRPGDHLRALENISRQLDKEPFRQSLLQATTAADVIRLLEDADQNPYFR